METAFSFCLNQISRIPYKSCKWTLIKLRLGRTKEEDDFQCSPRICSYDLHHFEPISPKALMLSVVREQQQLWDWAQEPNQKLWWAKGSVGLLSHRLFGNCFTQLMLKKKSKKKKATMWNTLGWFSPMFYIPFSSCQLSIGEIACLFFL